MVCRAVRVLATSGDWEDWNGAWSLALGVGREPEGAAAGALGRAILLARRGQLPRAWAALEVFDDGRLAEHVPTEAVGGALAAGSSDGAGRASAIARLALEAGAPARILLDLAGRLLVGAAGSGAAELDGPARESLAVLSRWVGVATPATPHGSIPIGILVHRRPDRPAASSDLGDELRSLAALGTLARMTSLRITGEEGLGELAAELQARVRTDLRLETPEGSVHLVPVERELASAIAAPTGTWLIAHGPHTEALYDLPTAFPYPAGLRPLYLGFHVRRPEILSAAALADLGRRGPIGCRDWSTVFLLLGAGVEAFFSGCLAATLDGILAAPERVGNEGIVGRIDLPDRGVMARAETAWIGWLPPDPALDAGGRLRAADRTLALARHQLDRAITADLGTYVALTAAGIPTELRPVAPGDIGLAGLTGLAPGGDRLEAMRDRIRAVLEPVLETIVRGGDEEAVYARWRDVTAELVAEARARFAAPIEDLQTTVDVGGAVQAALAGRRSFGPPAAPASGQPTDIVLSFDQNLLLPAAVLVESLVEHASGPLRLWILGRGLPDAYLAWLGGAFPDLPLTHLPCDRVSYGPGGRPRRVPSRITISTMDRLLVPELLPDVDRIVYLDVDTLMVGDVSRLGGIDLDGHPVAARDGVPEASEWQRAGHRLPEAEALELRRRMARRHGTTHPALNAGVLVMDLARMRRDGFTAQVLALVERYGLHDQDAMLAYAGPDRLSLDPRWNAMPVSEDPIDPWLVHWASFTKPWEGDPTYADGRWADHAARLRERAGEPPGQRSSS